MIEKTKIAALLSRAKSEGDIKAATELLRIAASYLNSRDLMPDELADHIAKAFTWATAATESDAGEDIAKERGERLLHSLGLTRNIGRPRVEVDEQEIHEFVVDEIIQCPNFSETQLKKKVAAKFGISETKALEFVKPTAFVPKLMQSNAIKSLIRKRD